MDEFDTDVWRELGAFEDYHDFLFEITAELAEFVFLSDNDYAPSAGDEYSFGHLRPKDWWPLVNQLDEMIELSIMLGLLEELDSLLDLPGVPTEVLEAPLAFLSSVLSGDLPPEPSGRRVGSRKLVKIAHVMVDLIRELPEAAQAAVRAWADVHRNQMGALGLSEFGLTDFLASANLPPALTGFSMMISLTLMLWPDRAEGLPVPPGFLEADLYDEVYAEWQDLPDSPAVTEEGEGEAEALFAQGQLAYLLAEMGAVELMTAEELDAQDQEAISMAYSRLSRAILWIHNQCRRCPQREGVTCTVADNWPERPVPLLDLAGEIANTSRIGGCVKMNNDQ